MKKHRGFTLIELLVVIAIIGILAAVVLASLGTARNKAKDKAIVADLVSIRSEVALYFTTNGTVNLAGGTLGPNLCYYSTDTVGPNNVFETTKFKEIISHASIQSGAPAPTTGARKLAGNTRCFANSNGTDWSVAVLLNEKNGTNGTAWCVDSTGKSKQYNLTTATDLATGAIDTVTNLCN